MLRANETRQVKKIGQELKTLSALGKRQTIEGSRRVDDLLRSALRLHEDVVRRCRRDGLEPRGREFSRLKRLAGRALDELGGQDSRAAVSLKDYDHDRYGPFLGVSDEGSATPVVRAAAMSSPKMKVLGDNEPLVVGVSLDAERLAAAGEMAIGPDEYREIRLECVARILTSTNVGTRLNLRYYKQRPRVEVGTGPLDGVLRAALEEAEAILTPFVRTPDGVSRPTTVFVSFAVRTPRARRLEVLGHLHRAFRSGDFCDPEAHRLGILTFVRRGWIGVRAVRAAIDLATKAGLSEVAVEGIVRREAEAKISMPDLLNFFSAKQTNALLEYACKMRVGLTPWNVVDPQTVARHVWAPLRVARNMGLELGKYGLFPLTIEQSDEIMRMIQSWFRDWSAAPALYVDLPIVAATQVYTEPNIMQGIRLWLKVASKNGIPLALIDTTDKDKGRKLLKRNTSDLLGILHREQIAELDGYARNLGIKVLWAGGLTIPQAYEMGRLQVFGIYVTTAVSASRPVTGSYRFDRTLASEKEPTFQGVAHVKLLLESGFLVTRLEEIGREDQARELERQARALITALGEKRNHCTEAPLREQAQLMKLAVAAWQTALADLPGSSVRTRGVGTQRRSHG